jgi:hypothetical protein
MAMRLLTGGGLALLALARRADVADVVMLAASQGPVQLYPAALAVDPDSTIAAFDIAHPEGADFGKPTASVVAMQLEHPWRSMEL